jgi:hypothetical protein
LGNAPQRPWWGWRQEKSPPHRCGAISSCGALNNARFCICPTSNLFYFSLSRLYHVLFLNVCAINQALSTLHHILLFICTSLTF